MRIHHLNCGCMCPLGGALFDGFSKGLTAQLVCHCLLLETDQHGLVLVDTGFGTEDVRRPGERLSPFFRALNNIRLEPRYTALEQLHRLGFAAEDVRHIVLTHLDFDHAGACRIFRRPRCTCCSARWMPPGDTQLHRPQPLPSPAVGRGAPLAVLRAGRRSLVRLPGRSRVARLPPEIQLIPLTGHTHGHAGVAVQTDSGWLLHAGDAYFFREEVGRNERHCTPGLRFYQRMMEVDRTARLANQHRLWTLSLEHRDEVTLFCSHDAQELARMQRGAH